MRSHPRGAAFAFALVALLAGRAAEAQVTTGTITGTVKDEQGAAVPGATVTGIRKKPPIDWTEGDPIPF